MEFLIKCYKYGNIVICSDFGKSALGKLNIIPVSAHCFSLRLNTFYIGLINLFHICDFIKSEPANGNAALSPFLIYDEIRNCFAGNIRAFNRKSIFTEKITGGDIYGGCK